MKVIDFISLGAEHVVYIISEKGLPVVWQGTRREFIHEMSAFFLLFHRTVIEFDIAGDDVLKLYI